MEDISGLNVDSEFYDTKHYDTSLKLKRLKADLEINQHHLLFFTYCLFCTLKYMYTFMQGTNYFTEKASSTKLEMRFLGID